MTYRIFYKQNGVSLQHDMEGKDLPSVKTAFEQLNKDCGVTGVMRLSA
jgi:hypothetical protein